MARFEEYYDDRHVPSSGVAKAGLATGIVGSSLAGLLGLGAMGYGSNRDHGHCNEEILVNRHDAQKDHEIMMLTTENAMLKGDQRNDEKLLKLYAYIVGKNERFEGALAAQAIQNQKTADTFTILRGELNRETQARCCADNTIVNYVNNTFYPQEIAAVTVKPDLTNTKRIYNPLPGECCNDGCNSGCGSLFG